MIRTLFFATAAFSFSLGAASAAEKMLNVDRDRLADPVYIETLYAEIESAALEVCKKDLRGAPFYRSRMVSCIKFTVKNAVKQVDDPAFTTFAEGASEIGRIASR
ncbi:UrcA family protein [Hyphococcus sp.]|uniref:UrcA family protein n=1 Tax=Hyphococcus sp. TaxID=2038636 RepID=UPI003CCC04A4